MTVRFLSNFHTNTLLYFLTEREQEDYWSSVRHKKREEAAKKKVRGRDKLLQQAMKTATHIRFVDDDSNKEGDDSNDIAGGSSGADKVADSPKPQGLVS